jgi:hypothetical protein
VSWPHLSRAHKHLVFFCSALARTRPVSPKLLGFIFLAASDLVHAPDSLINGLKNSRKQ